MSSVFLFFHTYFCRHRNHAHMHAFSKSLYCTTRTDNWQHKTQPCLGVGCDCFRGVSTCCKIWWCWRNRPSLFFLLLGCRGVMGLQFHPHQNPLQLVHHQFFLLLENLYTHFQVKQFRLQKRSQVSRTLPTQKAAKPAYLSKSTIILLKCLRKTRNAVALIPTGHCRVVLLKAVAKGPAGSRGRAYKFAFIRATKP